MRTHVAFLLSVLFDNGPRRVSSASSSVMSPSFPALFSALHQSVQQRQSHPWTHSLKSSIPWPRTFGSHLSPLSKPRIRRYARHVHFFQSAVFHRPLRVWFVVGDADTDLDVLHEWARVLAWFLFIRPWATNASCAQSLDVFVYFLPDRKQFPSRGASLGPAHVNTGFTHSCVPVSEIVVYRREEWFKCLLHETFHALALDFSNQTFSLPSSSSLASLLPASSPLLLFEAYTECWARVLHVAWVAYDTLLASSRRPTAADWTRLAHRLWTREQDFSGEQWKRILRHFDLTWTDWSSARPLPASRRMRETTHVLAYYGYAGLLVRKFDRVLAWCTTHQSNPLQFGTTREDIVRFATQLERWREQDTREPPSTESPFPRSSLRMTRTERVSA
jgi:hypothetical protein